MNPKNENSAKISEQAARFGMNEIEFEFGDRFLNPRQIDTIQRFNEFNNQHSEGSLINLYFDALEFEQEAIESKIRKLGEEKARWRENLLSRISKIEPLSDTRKTESELYFENNEPEPYAYGILKQIEFILVEIENKALELGLINNLSAEPVCVFELGRKMLFLNEECHEKFMEWIKFKESKTKNYLELENSDGSKISVPYPKISWQERIELPYFDFFRRFNCYLHFIVSSVLETIRLEILNGTKNLNVLKFIDINSDHILRAIHCDLNDYEEIFYREVPPHFNT